MIDSIYRKYENCYPKLFLEKYNFNGDKEIYSDNSYNVDSDEEYPDDSDDSDEENSHETFQMKKIECISILISSYLEMQDNFFKEI